jgi:hypothetical protein
LILLLKSHPRILESVEKGDKVEPFNSQKLAKIRANLEQEGITFVVGEEGERLSHALGAEAVYIPEPGGPGIIVLSKNPSRSAVIEELIHLGQHRRSNWGDVSYLIPRLEVEAQHKLLKIGQRKGWSLEEIERIQRALKIWEDELK